jgi:hypothetical protein
MHVGYEPVHRWPALISLFRSLLSSIVDAGGDARATKRVGKLWRGRLARVSIVQARVFPARSRTKKPGDDSRLVHGFGS